MNANKRAAKEAIIAVINDQLSQPQTLRKQVYLTETREKHENEISKDEILRTHAKKHVDSYFKWQSEVN